MVADLILFLVFILFPSIAFLIQRWSKTWRSLRWLARIYLGLTALLAAFILIGQLVVAHQPLRPLTVMRWGVTFSASTSTYYGSDWQKAYLAILTDLKPAIVRIPVYWDQIEKQPGVYDFSDLDWQIEQAKQQHIPIQLAVGQKSPRWPECHYPTWVNSSNQAEREQQANQMLTQVVQRYASNPGLESWQVENEAFLKYVAFVNCPSPVLTKEEVAAEIQLVKRLDPHHWVSTTDLGEAGTWFTAYNLSDHFGTTMYRYIYNNYTGKVETYPYTPEMYTLRAFLVKTLARQTKPIYIAELQAEPWGRTAIPEMSVAEQQQYFSPDHLQQALLYAERARLDDPTILWGAEWWYRMKEEGVPEYWQRIKAVMNP